ncbi:MAG: ATP-binding protein [Patescibacteria group bacterium]
MDLKQKWQNLISSNNSDDDQNRREKILNLLLVYSIIAFTIINLVRISDYFIYTEETGLPLWTTLLILSFFIILLWLSKQNYGKLASSLLIITYALPMFYSFSVWGTDLPAGLLLAVLIITLSGVLLSARLALISTSLISIFLILMTNWQAKGYLSIQNYWRYQKTEIADAIVYSALLMIIAIIAWLFARGIKQALARARQSEAELKKERDSLEIKVAERTAKLRQIEAEKINQLYRLAEFGRLSSGIFHDLINPLTAISLNLEQVRGQAENTVLNAKSYLNQALLATHRMENLISGIKKQIQKESNLGVFLINEEIEQIIQILAYKARQTKVLISFSATTQIKLYGDAVKFGQIITNLLANAIEASEVINNEINSQKNINDLREVKIDLSTQNSQAKIMISDRGVGIAPENITKIFEPFFSTKKENGRGLGLGLASTKNITEKDFHGTITVASQPGEGCSFIVLLPINIVDHEK